MTVLEDHRFLHFLVDVLELVYVWPVSGDIALERAKLSEVVLERALAQAHRRHNVELLLDPLTNDVCGVGELPAQALVVLLSHHLRLQCLVAFRHQCPGLAPLLFEILAGIAKRCRLLSLFIVVTFTYREVGHVLLRIINDHIYESDVILGYFTLVGKIK